MSQISFPDLEEALSTASKANINLSTAGTNPKEFGPSTWDYIHRWTLKYPLQPTLQQRIKAQAHLTSIQEELGCTTCSHHFAEHLDVDLPDFTDRHSLVVSLWKAHNRANFDLHKPYFSWAQFQHRYRPATVLSASEEAAADQCSISGGAACVWSYFLSGLLLGVVIVLVLAALYAWFSGYRVRIRSSSRLQESSQQI